MMNAGNKSRGRADGFLIDSFSRSFSVKDSEGRSVMKMVIDELYKDDETIIKFKEQFANCYGALKSKAKDIKVDSDKAQISLNLNVLLYEKLIKADPAVAD